MAKLLSASEMEEAGEILNQCFLQVFTNLFSPANAEDALAQTAAMNSKVNILTFVINLLRVEKPYRLFTPEGLSHFQDLYFKDSEILDFLNMVSFHFYARWGVDEERYHSLVLSLTGGVASSPFEVCKADELKINAMPPEIAERHATYENTRDLLLTNRWMTLLLLMMLFLRVPSET